VVTGEIEVGTPDGGARRHVVELYLASTVAGWRVAEVAL
jgi:hypothetical protein